MADAVNSFLKQMLRSPDPETEGKDVKVVEILAIAADKVDEEFKNQPLNRIAIHGTISSTYQGLGILDKAFIHAKKAVELASDTLDESNETALDVSNAV